MAIDITSCLNTVHTLRGYITACFAKCTAKGSTYSGTNTLANLETAIDLIPTGSGSGGTISENINGASFELFTVTKPDKISPNEFTIDFGSVGVTWRSSSAIQIPKTVTFLYTKYQATSALYQHQFSIIQKISLMKQQVFFPK